VKASLTAAIVVRSLLAAERSDWERGVLVDWVVDRLVVCGPVVGSVVVAVDMLLIVWGLFGIPPMGTCVPHSDGVLFDD
jgi:hypothetical protein